MAKSERPTVQLTEPFVPETSTYSVSKRRANTEDERAAQASRIERPGIPERLHRRAGSEPVIQPLAKRIDNRILVMLNGQEIELDLGDARDLAELILKIV